MNLKSELALLAVRYLSAKTDILPKADPFAELTSILFTGETAEQRQAKAFVAAADKAIDRVKTARTNRQFKKIVEKI